MTSSIIFLLSGTMAYACLWAGVIAHQRRRTHLRWMLTGVGLDVTVVLGLELSRHAVETVVSGGMSTALLVHVWASTVAILFYVGAVTLGTLYLRGQGSSVVRWHRRVGRAAMTARSVGFVMMLVASDVNVQEKLLLAALPVVVAALAWSRYREWRLPLPARMQVLREAAHDDR